MGMWVIVVSRISFIIESHGRPEAYPLYPTIDILFDQIYQGHVIQ